MVAAARPQTNDPAVLTPSDLELPRAWPDYVFRRIGAFFRFLRTLLFGGRDVVLPPGLRRGEELPAYLLREFHRMPNGYYSHVLANGYERGFERAMLGHVASVRIWMAEQTKDSRAVLDIGCGSGKLAGAMASVGVPDVWAIDASLYQLKIAAREYPALNLVHGLAESTPFDDGRFDAVGACFLFHELPTEAQNAVLAEVRRVLRPGGILVIAEPSPEQVRDGLRTLWRQHGWRGIYFRVLAKFVTEPYLEQWHGRSITEWATGHGFVVEKDESKVPFRRIVLRRS
ncbi:MAG: class I SAM-dependent methyltransferase [Deltaproteobacteria bacterium]|nr:class I SAM-dependent methyltransferase [Deltaproteobacteria bacterium]